LIVPTKAKSRLARTNRPPLDLHPVATKQRFAYMNSTNCLNNRQQIKPVFVSGYGQFHTNEADPAKPSKRLTPYELLSRQDIESMVDNPVDEPKAHAQWMIASSLKSRVFAEQEKNGLFQAMVNDFDSNPPALDKLAEIVKEEFDCNFELYTTKSATQEKQKARLILFLAKPLNGEQYLICQGLMVDLFKRYGIESDLRVLEAGQLFYLPNRGEFYKSISVRDGKDFDPLEQWALEIDLKRQEAIKAELLAKAKQEEARRRREALQASSDTSANSLINQFNKCFAVEDILLGAGYAQRGNSFRHPYSESGSYSASVKGGRVYSLSPNDPLYTANDSNGAHDAFSAFSAIYHAGNTSDALKDAGDNWLRVGNESYNKACQRAYMQERENNGLVSLSGSLAQLQPSIDPVTGELIEPVNNPFLDLMTMEVTKETVEKLDDAKFIYSQLIVAGHFIVFCAKANGGKTTIMVYVSAELAKAGYRVLYINADASASDLKTYAEHAHDHGYTLLNPDLTNGSAEKVITSLKGMSQQLEADYSKTVLILDTLKKFADLMQKSKAKEFNNILRALTAKGMTIICLAHTNKYNDADGKPIFEGTGDLRNDVDELIYFIPVKNEDGTMTVSTDADKVRAKVENMSFSISADGEVSVLDGYVDTLSIAHEQRQYKEDESIIEFIQGEIGFESKTVAQLYKKSKDAELGIAKRRLQAILNRYAEGKSKNPKWLAMPVPTNGYRYGLIADGYLAEALKKVGGG